jgi:hypothetical protein
VIVTALEVVMSFPEYLSCRFGLQVDGHGRKPSHMDIEFISKGDSLTRMQIDRLYLTFKDGTTISQAEELEAAMNRCLRGLCIVHSAEGEEG